MNDGDLDAMLHDAAVELDAAELPTLAEAVREARRRLELVSPATDPAPEAP